MDQRISSPVVKSGVDLTCCWAALLKRPGFNSCCWRLLFMISWQSNLAFLLPWWIWIKKNKINNVFFGWVSPLERQQEKQESACPLMAGLCGWGVQESLQMKWMDESTFEGSDKFRKQLSSKREVVHFFLSLLPAQSVHGELLPAMPNYPSHASLLPRHLSVLMGCVPISQEWTATELYRLM